MRAGPPRVSARFLTARGCLELLWASWETCPVALPARAILNSAAGPLPPIPRVGLELRLGTGEMRVDLHQLVTRDGGEAAVLSDYLSRGQQWADSAAGERVRAFLGAWGEEESRFGAVFQQFYVEYDLTEEGAALRLPSLFFDVHRRLEDREERLAGEALIVAAIEQLQGPMTRRRRDGLEKCFAAVNGRGSIGHLGIMPGRDGQPIRLNVKDLRRGDLLPLLDGIGWAGDRDGAEGVFNRLIDEVDLVTVALDLAGEWLPGIGFEAFIKAQPEVDPRWQKLLGWLCEEGLCTEDECGALLQFPGVAMPGPLGSRWPASWLVAAALTPEEYLPVFRRELSHVKVTLKETGERGAKAYLGTCHEWRIATPMRNAGETACATKAEHTKGRVGQALAIAASVEAAQDFLISRLSQGGFWRDFHLEIGYSDEWVTAFVASQMALTGSPRGLAAARYALSWLLRRQRPSGGWGYNGFSPPDADSTAWVLRLAMACGVETEATVRAWAFLAGHLLADGAVTTYCSATPIRFRDRDCGDGEVAGWRAAHNCVAANAAALMGEGALDALRRNQSASGAWRAYWWGTDVFATALAAESLRDGVNVERAIHWAEDANEEASAFDLAWRLRLLGLASGTHREVTLGIRRLLELQQADGGWPAGAPMLFPQPSEIDRTAGAPVCIDQERNFTTASVQAALAMALQQTSEREAAA